MASLLDMLDMFAFLVRRPRSQPIDAPPVVIGALGGSGTRAVAKIVRLGGFWMGGRVSRRTEDSLPFRYFLNRSFESLLDFPAAAPHTQKPVLACFHRAVAGHREGIAGADTPWGWKNPRNMWLIPFYRSVFPQLKFIHVIRDGRDMSLSRNLFLLKTHGDRLLGSDWRKDPEAAQTKLWTEGNLRAADEGRQGPPNHYFLLRYEDLCLKPAETVGKLYDFLGAPAALVGKATGEIRPSSGIGRGEARGAGTDRLDPAFQQALERFGYRSH
jgi:hypothetical protein